MEGKQSSDLSCTLIDKLHHAATNGNDSKVTLLLQAGCDVNEQDENGKTALMLAVAGGHVTTVATLLKFHPNIYAKDKFGKNVLQMVFELNLKHKAIIEMFLNVLKEECVGDSKKLAMKLMSVKCPLYLAVLLKDVEVTRLLLKNGCTVNTTDPYSHQTALHVSLEIRDFANSELLMQSGADVNALDSSRRIPLACLRNFNDSNEELKIVQMLIGRNSRLDLIDGNGDPQLYKILSLSKPKVLRLALKSTINWSAIYLDKSTPLHYLACNPTVQNHPHILNELRFKTINVRQPTYPVQSLITLAIQKNLPELVELLLYNGANTNIHCHDSDTLLLNVSSTAEDKRKSENIFTLLLEHGAEFEIDILSDILKTGNDRFMNLSVGFFALNVFRGSPTLPQIGNIINSNYHLKNEFESCMVQLQRLKEITFENKMNLLDFLNISDKMIATLARDQNFVKYLTDFNSSNFNSYYVRLFERKIDRALQLIQTRKEFADLLCKIMKIRGDSYPSVIDRIIDYILT